MNIGDAWMDSNQSRLVLDATTPLAKYILII